MSITRKLCQIHACRLGLSDSENFNITIVEMHIDIDDYDYYEDNEFVEYCTTDYKSFRLRACTSHFAECNMSTDVKIFASWLMHACYKCWLNFRS